MSSIERSKVSVSLEIIEKLADALDVDIADLLAPIDARS